MPKGSKGNDLPKKPLRDYLLKLQRNVMVDDMQQEKQLVIQIIPKINFEFL